MPQAQVTEVKCPKCNALGGFRVYKSINSHTDKEAAKRLYDGEIFFFTCPSCGAETPVFFPTLYDDVDAKVMVHLEYKNTAQKLAQSIEAARGNALIPGSDPDYDHRIVFDRNEFREKSIILRDGYDEGVMEIFKLYTKVRATQTDQAKDEDHLYYMGTDGDEICLEFYPKTEADVGAFRVPRSLYDDVIKQHGDHLGHGAGYIVNEQWALQFILAHAKE